MDWSCLRCDGVVINRHLDMAIDCSLMTKATLDRHQANLQKEAGLTALRADAVRQALLLTYITIGWMTIEGAAALLLGWASKSLLLEAFGIDSVIELFSAAVLLWRLRVEASGSATSHHVNLVERRAARLVGYSLYALVAYVVLNSGYGLFIAKRITDTHESVWGILIGAVAKIGMPILAGYKLKVAARLNSRALRADAVESITCGYLSIVLMIGLAATRLLGWWWLDSIAALALIPFLIKEAREAVSGGCDDCGDGSGGAAIGSEQGGN
jgi:divalent metal cation (Fe/Co/Zn/Cd) transporter